MRDVNEINQPHVCTLHKQANCHRSHQAVPHVRPSAPNRVPSGDWRPATAEDTHPRYAWRIFIGFVIFAVITAVILIFAARAGSAAADGFGPLIPSPTPYPQGWTP